LQRETKKLWGGHLQQPITRRGGGTPAEKITSKKKGKLAKTSGIVQRGSESRTRKRECGGVRETI